LPSQPSLLAWAKRMRRRGSRGKNCLALGAQYPFANKFRNPSRSYSAQNGPVAPTQGMLTGWSFCFRTSVGKFYAKRLDPSSGRGGRNVSLGHALRRERGPLREWNIQFHLNADCRATGHSLATDYGLRRISATSFVGQRSDVAVAAEGIFI
jgi:hypothetical protein